MFPSSVNRDMVYVFSKSPCVIDNRFFRFCLHYMKTAHYNGILILEAGGMPASRPRMSCVKVVSLLHLSRVARDAGRSTTDPPHDYSNDSCAALVEVSQLMEGEKRC